MDMITVNTGRTGFVMIDQIIRVDRDQIVTAKRFDDRDGQIHSAIEVMAQTGAMHVRYMTGFSQHAFLLTIEHYHCEVFFEGPGDCRVKGKLISQSKRAFAHDLCLTNEAGPIACGRFLFALCPYDKTFNRELLESHYLKVFECLKNAT